MVLPLLYSCKTVYQTASFADTFVPSSPNYEDTRSWAVLPEHYPVALTEITGEFKSKPADVFFIYPTILTDPKNPTWNANIYDRELNNKIVDRSIKFQASAFAKAGNLYAPFYRQSHYKIYVPPYDQQEELSRKIAYSDIRRAFQYYLDHYHNDRPIIIASHSQGSIMAGMLLKEFFDGTPLQFKLVAAYIPGVKINDEMFQELQKMETPTEIGGYVTWNTYKQKKLPKNYESYYKEGTVTNPITWDKSKSTTFDQHKGVLYSDGKIYKNALEIQLIEGMIWSSLPKIPKRFLFSLLTDYHFADINLFWKDIESNTLERLASWEYKYAADAR